MSARARRLLVIAPHADDEVIGCGGTIARAVHEGVRVDVVVMGLGGVVHRLRSECSSSNTRSVELAKSNRRLGITDCHVLFPGQEMRLDEVPLIDIVTALDAVLDDGYDEVYLPPPDHNADHCRTHQAALAALRPGARPGVGLIASYETVNSSWAAPPDSASMYVDISDFLDAKLDAMGCYASQLQPYPHPVSLEGVRRMATFRAAEAFMSRACERFTLLRIQR